MDAQQRFVASTLQGAMDANVLTNEDVYRHVTAQVLAEHVSPEILWACLVEGLEREGLGPGGGAPRRPTPQPKEVAEAAEPEEPEEHEQAEEVEELEAGEEVEELDVDDEIEDLDGGDEIEDLDAGEIEDLDAGEIEAPEEPGDDDDLPDLEATPLSGGSIDIDVSDALDDLPPLPEDEELAVEDVDWDDNK